MDGTQGTLKFMRVEVLCFQNRIQRTRKRQRKLQPRSSDGEGNFVVFYVSEM